MILANDVERDLWLREQGRYLGNAVIGSDLMMPTIMRDAAAWADAAVDAYRERTPEDHGYVEARPSSGVSTWILRGWAGTVAGLDSDAMAKMTDDQILGAVADLIPVDACADMAEHADEILSSSVTGISLIEAERARHKWSPAHDDQHDDGALAIAAAELTLLHTDEDIERIDGDYCTGEPDTWGLVKKHRGNTIKCLTIAGSLIAAEIDRLLRAQAKR